MNRVCVIFLLLSIRCIKSSGKVTGVQERIVGGEAINIQDAPYQCAIMYSGAPICGCVIIGKRFVLSTAHCFMESAANFTDKFVEDQKKKTKIKIGVTSTLEEGEIRYIADLHIHPKFVYKAGKFSSDIVLIEVSSEFNYSPKVKYIPVFGQKLLPGSKTYITGYGSTKSDELSKKSQGPQPNYQLHGAPMVISNFRDCKAAYKNISVLFDNTFLCATAEKKPVEPPKPVEPGKPKSACYADNGGPLVTKDKKGLVGLVAVDVVCDFPQRPPQLFTRVVKFMPWIKKVMLQRRSSEKLKKINNNNDNMPKLVDPNTLKKGGNIGNGQGDSNKFKKGRQNGKKAEEEDFIKSLTKKIKENKNVFKRFG